MTTHQLPLLVGLKKHIRCYWDGEDLVFLHKKNKFESYRRIFGSELMGTVVRIPYYDNREIIGILKFNGNKMNYGHWVKTIHCVDLTTGQTVKGFKQSFISLIDLYAKGLEVDFTFENYHDDSVIQKYGFTESDFEEDNYAGYEGDL